MTAPTAHPRRTVTVGDIAVAVQEYREGEPLLVVDAPTRSMGSRAEVAPVLARTFLPRPSAGRGRRPGARRARGTRPRLFVGSAPPS